MNTDNNAQKFICECSKEFDTQCKLSHHKTRCKIFQENKKRKIYEEKELKRLPNGMFKCENPDCDKEHNGSYGSGRFCCKKCRNHYNVHQGNLTKIANGTFICNLNRRKDNYGRSPYGTWKCTKCDLIFETRKQLQNHNKDVHNHSHRGCQRGFGWNRGLTKENSKSIALASLKVSKAVRQAYIEGRITGRCKDPLKEELRKKKISESMKKNPKAGGKRHGSGRGAQGWYKEYYCDSSWELAVIIYWLEHNFKFERCKESFEYIFEDQLHHYYPDFVLPDGSYVEVKGAEKTLQWKAKKEQFPKDKVLIIIGKNEINQYLDYVIQKYGKDFISLYEKKREVKS